MQLGNSLETVTDLAPSRNPDESLSAFHVGTDADDRRAAERREGFVGTGSMPIEECPDDE